jgi:hypothetical protein
MLSFKQIVPEWYTPGGKYTVPPPAREHASIAFPIDLVSLVIPSPFAP